MKDDAFFRWQSFLKCSGILAQESDMINFMMWQNKDFRMPPYPLETKALGRRNEWTMVVPSTRPATYVAFGRLGPMMEIHRRCVLYGEVRHVIGIPIRVFGKNVVYLANIQSWRSFFVLKMLQLPISYIVQNGYNV